jgi:hypothetical protein
VLLSGERMRAYQEVFKKYRSESPEAALAWYLETRNKFKHPKPGRRPVTARNKAFVYKKLVERQGTVAAGWNKAGAYFGITVPPWISKWESANSSLTRQESENTYKFIAVCSTSHPNAAELQADADKAMNMQKGNMKRILLNLLKKQNKRGGFVSK